MARALLLAAGAADEGEVPVGAVITDGAGKVVGEGSNRTRTDHDPTAHAEIVALRAAARHIGNERLTGCTLWVTLEPCAMCAAAIAEARIARLVYGASDPKGGGVEHGARIFAHSTHKPETIAGVGEQQAAGLLRGFFAARRNPPPHH